MNFLRLQTVEDVLSHSSGSTQKFKFYWVNMDHIVDYCEQTRELLLSTDEELFLTVESGEWLLKQFNLNVEA